ncbi:LON peptidase substrate-binding domain-containing protein [Magnetospirillum sp. UT-4]|uniref:LON peptidase substrate-binding domain-containing protein n=1 Tax=Magnetospirillum sp. UT-4 TaxID=2681467 RepID=UPI00137E249A|nr:LON peptidase substrate-binding domain-containing protein [Magnetospirillum sp. UT-4]CAA7622017.1 putative peptidase S16, lon N-terminal [Magnetospirillum sp. UT-4]
MAGLADFRELPGVLPVFAVAGALLLPGGRLPLTVFEPRYLALTDDCLGTGRLFALVQPGPEDGSVPVPGLQPVGCLARIVAFGETGDGRYLITGLGINRFRLVGEEPGRSGYRRVVADYAPFAGDREGEGRIDIDRRRLIAAVSAYLSHQGLTADMARLDDSNDTELVTALAMAAPLSPEEKQALLEAPSTTERAQLMTAMFEMALLTESGDFVRH